MESLKLNQNNEENDQQQATMVLMQLQAVLQAQKESMKILDKCFSKCVDIPGTELTKPQQQCIWNCTQRMFDSESFIEKRLAGMSGKK